MSRPTQRLRTPQHASQPLRADICCKNTDYSNTLKENGCFSCEKRILGRGFIEPIFLYLKYSP